MKKAPQKSSLRFWLGTAAAALVLLVICPQSAGAQTNTFPSTGNVGVGTTAPTQNLQIIGSSTSGIFGAFESSVGKGITFNPNTASGIVSIYADYLGGSEPKLHLSTYADATGAGGIHIVSGGNVGIGTAAPSTKLHVAGNGYVTGNLTVDGIIHAKYQDLAEWVPSSQTLSAGTVVVLDHTRSNQVVASSHAYDTRVAGVISLQPGITLGETGVGKVLVATTGRVKIKVDASAGPIQIGDLLVTSDKSGVAKKSEPLSLGGVAIHRPGTLIGKALEPLAKGTGEILVLLSLQ